VLCYPLIFGGQTLGILRVAARRPRAFDPIDRYAPLLDRFARLLSVTLYRSELYHQSDRQLQAIKEIGRTITRPMPVQEICHHVLHLAMRVLHVEVGAVGLLTAENTLELVAHHGCTLAHLPVLKLGEGISGTVVQSGTSRAIPDVTREPAYVVFNGRVRSELVAPIVYDREVIGFLDVESFEENRFREEDEQVIGFLEALANQAAIAIKAAQLRTEAVERLGTSMVIDPQLSMAGLQDLLIDELRDKIDQLAAANAHLAAASQAKSEFLAHMSHDLRGPLNVIVGLSSLLLDPTVAATLGEEKQRESLELIRSNGDVLGALIGNILDLSSLEAGKVQLDVASFDAAPTFEYLRATTETLAMESRKELAVLVTVHPAITSIKADEEKFLRIMQNLISNAVKFTPSGGQVSVTASIDTGLAEPGYPRSGSAAPGPMAGAGRVQDHRDSAAGPSLHVTVQDTGIGIAPEDQGRIFEPFQQIDNQIARRGVLHTPYHGTGLGLTVVRQLVELHGGHIWVESRTGEGSAFHVVLPGALDVSEGSPEVGVGGAVGGHTLLPSPPADALQVLVVEDIPAHMKVMRLALTARGHTVQGVGSGEEALAWLADHRPDVMLLDMQLPGMDGFSVAEHVRGRVETHAVPVIAVSADALSVTEERALASGCDAYLTKPIDVATLLATIEHVRK
jgi:signal transduction histidine kinase